MDAFSFLVGIGVGSGLCSGLGSWVEEIWGKKQARRSRENAVIFIEKMAALRAQGALTDQEFEEQKRRCLAEVVGTPIVPEVASTPALSHVERLAELRDEGTLTEEEFAAQRERFLRIGAEAPTAEELARLDHIVKLEDLNNRSIISDEEYQHQKRELLAAGYAVAKPASPWADFDGH